MKIFLSILYSNIWLAFGAAIITFYSSTLAHTTAATKPLIWMVFFATLFGYNFQKIIKYRNITEGKSEYQNWMIKNRILLIAISLFCLQAMLILAARNYVLFIAWWKEGLIAISIVLLYSFPLLKGNGLRELPGIKIFLVAGVWTLITAWLPVSIAIEIDFNLKAYVIIDRFLFIFCLGILFDNRDKLFDKSSMKTIPQIIGHSATIHLVVVVFVLLAFFPLLLVDSLLVGSCIFYLTACFAALQNKSVDTDLFYLLVIDGLILLQGIAMTAFFRINY
ncbi:MAG: hypothetical protein ACK4K0_06920 [Flavobacteriales bacterium]